MAGLVQAGRGKFDNGKPLTEIVASVDFDEVEYKLLYDPSGSPRLSVGLPPIKNRPGPHRPHHGCHRPARPPMTSQPAQEFFYKAYNVSFWTMRRPSAAVWLNNQFGTNIK